MDYISRHRPAIIVEILDNAVLERLKAQLSGIDYAWYRISEQAGPRAKIQESDGSADRNYLLCRGDIGVDLGRYPLTAI